MIRKSKVEVICKRLDVELISYKFLAKGNHNINYLVKTSKGNFLLRIENNKQFKNLKKEYNLLRSLKEGLAPKVSLFDNSHKILSTDYLIEEFIEGNHPSKNSTDNFVIIMAKWFKELHNNTKKSKNYSVKTAVKPYHKNYLKYRHHIRDQILSKKLDIYMNQTLKICKENDKLFSNIKTLSLLHNDSSRENIFYYKDKVKLIDWEFAAYGLPEREIVYFFDSYDLTDKQIKLFLESYGYPNNRIAKKKLEIQYIILLCSSIGYSLWRLDLVKDRKSRKEINKRLSRDIKLLSGKVS